MEYDVKLQKWVKKTDENERGDERGTTDASEDPFRDIESLGSERDDMSVREDQQDREEDMEEVEEVILEEEEDKIVYERHGINAMTNGVKLKRPS